MVLPVLIALCAASSIYALILSIPAVQEWHIPDWTWVTVVIGNTLILLAMVALWQTGDLSLDALLIFIGGNVAAGLPIIIWQIDQARRRRKEQSAKRRH